MNKINNYLEELGWLSPKKRQLAFEKLFLITGVSQEEIKEMFEKMNFNQKEPIYNREFFETNKEYCITKTMTKMGLHYPFWYSLVVLKSNIYEKIFGKPYQEIDLQERHQKIINNLMKSDFFESHFISVDGEVFCPKGVNFKNLVKDLKTTKN